MQKSVLVIGGGPGGYVAAIRAAQLGARVTLVEENKLGGTCLNRGCIPTKALYRSAELVDTLCRIDEFGMQLKGFSYDYSALKLRKDSIVAGLVKGIEQLMKANGIEVLYGRARFTGKKTVTVAFPSGNATEITADAIVVATGSVPAEPPVKGLDLPGVIGSDELLEAGSLPKSMIIIGGGVIGIEFAGIYGTLGTDVTVLEYMPSILPGVDSEIARRLATSLKRRGIKIETGVRVTEIRRERDSLKVCAESGKGEMCHEAATVLVATGRKPNIDGLGLEEAGIEHSVKGIRTDGRFMTSSPDVYAIGDVTGGIMLAHVASEQGKAVAEIIMGLEAPEEKVIPSCIFTFPEIATAGITEEEAKAAKIQYRTGKFMFGANGKAMAMGETEGFVKTIVDAQSNKILGVHIMGPHASDLIHEGVLAMQCGLTANDLERTVHAHPTLSEAFYESVLGAYGRALHIIPPRRP